MNSPQVHARLKNAGCPCRFDLTRKLRLRLRTETVFPFMMTPMFNCSIHLKETSAWPKKESILSHKHVMCLYNNSVKFITAAYLGLFCFRNMYRYKERKHLLSSTVFESTFKQVQITRPSCEVNLIKSFEIGGYWNQTFKKEPQFKSVLNCISS